MLIKLIKIVKNYFLNRFNTSIIDLALLIDAENFHIKLVILNDIRSTFPKFPKQEVSNELLEFLLLFDLIEEKFLLAIYFESELLEIKHNNQHLSFESLKFLVKEFLSEKDYEDCKVRDYLRAVRCPYDVALSFSGKSKKEYNKEMSAFLDRIGYKY